MGGGGLKGAFTVITVEIRYLAPRLSRTSCNLELKLSPGAGLVDLWTCGLVSVYHCNVTLDISNISHVTGCGLVSVYHCNVTLDISNISHVTGCGLVSVYHCNVTLDISNISHVTGRRLVSVYHCNVTLDISNLSHVPGCGPVLQCITVILPWISRT